MLLAIEVAKDRREAVEGEGDAHEDAEDASDGEASPRALLGFAPATIEDGAPHACGTFAFRFLDRRITRLRCHLSSVSGSRRVRKCR